MAAAMDASSDSPSHSTSGNENSPQLTSNCRNATVSSSSSRSLQSPWSQIVRGEAESSSTKSPGHSCPMPLSTNNIANRNHGPADSADSDHSTGKSVVEKGKSSGTKVDEVNNDASLAIKRPAWSKLSSGPTLEAGPVMGAASWPALSESSARSASLRSSSDSPNTPPLPVTDEPSPTSLQAVPIAMLDHQRVPSQNASANPMPNHSNRHRASSRRTNNSNNNNNNTSSNNNNDISNGGASSPMMESPHRAAYGTENAVHAQRGSREGSNTQGQARNDHPRNSFRRGNSGGSHTRAEGSYHGNYGNRREHQDGRSNSEWNSSSHHGNNQRGGYGARDVHAQQRVGPRSFTRQPPAAPVYMSVPPPPPPPPQAAPQRGFHTPPIGYVTDMGVYYLPAMHVPTLGPAPHAESIPAMQFIAPGPPPNMFFPPPEPPLQFMLVTQIEYYFSSENLCRDIYLRTNMDAEGWVPISMIAEFNRVKMLTTNIPFILASLDQRSSLVEVQGHKVRRRIDWKNWLLPPNSPAQDSVSNSNVSSLVNHFQAVGFEESGHQSIPGVPVEVAPNSEQWEPFK